MKFVLGLFSVISSGDRRQRRWRAGAATGGGAGVVPATMGTAPAGAAGPRIDSLVSIPHRYIFTQRFAERVVVVV
ncbi:unnamed protein product [Cuscuta campestris]|uniref:Uncharacterized protein n=1 Tax=Cuscuta campestris TaxID=132261 RepID=A0A484K404_9ASTE|nr:unnamed protein product [Cuscuta campestris]